MGSSQRKTRTKARTKALDMLGSTDDEADPSRRLMAIALSQYSSPVLNFIRDMLLLPLHRGAIELCE